MSPGAEARAAFHGDSVHRRTLHGTFFCVTRAFLLFFGAQDAAQEDSSTAVPEMDPQVRDERGSIAAQSLVMLQGWVTQSLVMLQGRVTQSLLMLQGRLAQSLVMGITPRYLRLKYIGARRSHAGMGEPGAVGCETLGTPPREMHGRLGAPPTLRRGRDRSTREAA